MNAADVMIEEAARIAGLMPENFVIAAIEAAETGTGTQPDKSVTILVHGPNKGRGQPCRIKSAEHPAGNTISCPKRNVLEEAQCVYENGFQADSDEICGSISMKFSQRAPQTCVKICVKRNSDRG